MRIQEATVLVVLGGLALFLMGLAQTSAALEALGGTSLRRLLSRATRGVLRPFVAATALTAVVQSGTALTVTVISLIDAGVIAFREGLALSLGATLGGTAALQLAAFRVFDYALPMVAAGYFASLWAPLREAGRAVSGIGLFFLGLDLMIRALEPATEGPLAALLLETFSQNPLLLAGLGFVFTALVHSSNATAALAMALALTERLDLEAALALVVGGNVGTMLTPLVAAAGSGVEARRVALAHLGYKLVAGVAFLLFLEPYTELVRWVGGGEARLVANAHTLFNLIAALPALALIPLMERVMRRVVPDTAQAVRPKYLSEEALASPVLAVSLALREVVRISDQVAQIMGEAVRSLAQGERRSEAVHYREEKVDRLTEAVVLYLAKLHGEARTAVALKLLLLTNALEHLADLVRRLLKQQDKLRAKGLEFSREGREELADAAARVYRRMQEAFAALATGNAALARRIVAEREAMEDYLQRLRQAHLGRLEAGRPESRASSAAHLDMLMTLDAIDVGLTRVAELVPEVHGGDDGKSTHSGREGEGRAP